jgi:hypothetical protein
MIWWLFVETRKKKCGSQISKWGQKKNNLLATRFPEMTWWLLSLKQEKKNCGNQVYKWGKEKKNN